MSRPGLSVVVPVFNEAENLAALQSELVAALDRLAGSFEVIYVDDGSTDDSPAVLRRLASADARVRILRLRSNAGQSAAFAAGFQAARADTLVTLDADLQNDPADIPRLLSELADCDVVCGVRVERHDSWLRRISSRIANAVRNRLTAESIADVGCTLRVYRTRCVRGIPMFTGMHRFLPTLLKADGARVKEVPVSHRPRLHGTSKYGVHNRLWKALADLLAVRWMLQRWIDLGQVDEVTGPPEGA